MYLVDTAAQERANDPIRTAIFGAGFIASGLLANLRNRIGVRPLLVVNRTVDKATEAIAAAGYKPIMVETQKDLEAVAAQPNAVGVTDNPDLGTTSELVEAVVEVTGTVEYAAKLISDALANGKHVINMNAEIDAYVGPAFVSMANKNGVVYTVADGDQPAAEMNVLRYVRTLGATPLLAGSIKGLIDHYRTPETQAGFAAQWGQTPEMVTSFADGTKISFEQAVVANATGFSVAKRGMLGPELDGPIEAADQVFDLDLLRSSGGLVDYVLGATPGPGVFVLAEMPDDSQKIYLDYLKMGDGPLYCFYQPCHLCHLELPNSIVRAVEFNDVTIAPTEGLCVDVITTAKQDLTAGQTLDGLGEFDTFGQCENFELAASEDLLPIAAAKGSILKHAVAKDSVIKYSDVEIPQGRFADELRSTCV